MPTLSITDSKKQRSPAEKEVYSLNAYKVCWEENIEMNSCTAVLQDKEINFLLKNINMWSGLLGKMRVTTHRMNLEPGTKHFRPIPCRQSPASLQIIVEKISISEAPHSSS